MVNLLTYYIEIIDFINYDKILAEFNTTETDAAKIDNLKNTNTEFDALAAEITKLIAARDELKKIIV